MLAVMLTRPQIKQCQASKLQPNPKPLPFHHVVHNVVRRRHYSFALDRAHRKGARVTFGIKPQGDPVITSHPIFDP